MRRTVVGLALALAGCQHAHASREDCEAIFERIVALELEEMGFRDAVLVERRRAALEAEHRASIDECIGRPMPEGALACVRSAPNVEALLHDCLEH